MNGQCKGKEVCTSGVPSRAGLTLVALLLGVGLAVFLIVAAGLKLPPRSYIWSET